VKREYRTHVGGNVILFHLLERLCVKVRLVAVQEKELRVREIMRMMGMSDASYWASWFLYHTMISTAISCIAYLLAGYGIFSFSDPTLIWAVFWLYG